MRFIILDKNNIVISVRHGKEILDGEIESELGEINQKMLADGTFVNVKPVPVEPQPTTEDRLEAIEATVAYNQLQTEYLVILAEFNAM